MEEFLTRCSSTLWNPILFILLLTVALLLTFRLKGMQLRYLPYALKLAFSRKDDQAKGDISQFQSLMMALAATIGIGSIAGMATAIMAGGLGAIFWMWVMAFLGMATKYAEAVLAVKYRQQDEKKEMCGGPMYYIEKGLKLKWLAVLFAIFGALSSFAGGNLTQSHSIADALYYLSAIPRELTAITAAALAAIAIFGGVKSLGRVNSILVPIMALFYITGGLIIIFMHLDQVLPTFQKILDAAFSGQAAFGGFVGAGVMQALQYGMSRGISSNEAGLGSAPIAAAAAKTDHPARQALISMTGVFLSSFIVCTITVLVISVTNVMGLEITGEVLNGAPLVIHAFQKSLPYGEWIVGIGIILFGFSTILGWAYYGEKCMEYLFGRKVLSLYRSLFVLMIFFGPLLSLHLVWQLVDLMNGLMALPNLIALLFLTPVVVTESREFFLLIKREKRGRKAYLS